MALEDIFRALEEQAERDVQAILSEARRMRARYAKRQNARRPPHGRTVWPTPSVPPRRAALKT